MIKVSDIKANDIVLFLEAHLFFVLNTEVIGNKIIIKYYSKNKIGFPKKIYTEEYLSNYDLPAKILKRNSTIDNFTSINDNIRTFL